MPIHSVETRVKKCQAAISPSVASKGVNVRPVMVDSGVSCAIVTRTDHDEEEGDLFDTDDSADEEMDTDSNYLPEEDYMDDSEDESDDEESETRYS